MVAIPAWLLFHHGCMVAHLGMVGHGVGLVFQDALVGDEREGENLVVTKRTRRLSEQLH